MIIPGWIEELAAEMFSEAGMEQGLTAEVVDAETIERFVAMVRVPLTRDAAA
jgi:hypothetical protein